MAIPVQCRAGYGYVYETGIKYNAMIQSACGLDVVFVRNQISLHISA